MPRFFFHLLNAEARTLDEEGQELTSLDEARARAVESIRSIVADDARQGRIDLRASIEVLAEEGKRVMVVPFTDAVEIISGPPPVAGEQPGIIA